MLRVELELLAGECADFKSLSGLGAAFGSVDSESDTTSFVGCGAMVEVNPKWRRGWN